MLIYELFGVVEDIERSLVNYELIKNELVNLDRSIINCYHLRWKRNDFKKLLIDACFQLKTLLENKKRLLELLNKTIKEQNNIKEVASLALKLKDLRINSIGDLERALKDTPSIKWMSNRLKIYVTKMEELKNKKKRTPEENEELQTLYNKSMSLSNEIEKKKELEKIMFNIQKLPEDILKSKGWIDDVVFQFDSLKKEIQALSSQVTKINILIDKAKQKKDHYKTVYVETILNDKTLKALKEKRRQLLRDYRNIKLKRKFALICLRNILHFIRNLNHWLWGKELIRFSTQNGILILKNKTYSELDDLGRKIAEFLFLKAFFFIKLSERAETNFEENVDRS